MILEVERTLLVKGKKTRVKARLRFSPEAAVDLLLPLAINSPNRMATECDSLVCVVITKMETINEDEDLHGG